MRLSHDVSKPPTVDGYQLERTSKYKYFDQNQFFNHHHLGQIWFIITKKNLFQADDLSLAIPPILAR